MPRNFSRTLERTFDESSREQRTKFAHFESKTFGQYCTFYIFFSLISSKHGYNTRLASKSTYYIDQVRTNYGKFNIHFSGPSVWNNMAENLKTCSSLHLFKHMLKADILSTYS